MPRRHTNQKHQPFTLHSPCGQKRAFNTEAQASEAADNVNDENLSVEVYTYHCPYCHKWHLSSKKS